MLNDPSGSNNKLSVIKTYRQGRIPQNVETEKRYSSPSVVHLRIETVQKFYKTEKKKRRK